MAKQKESELCKQIRQAQLDRAKGELARWQELESELGAELLSQERVRVVRDAGNGPVGLHFPRYLLTIELSNDHEMLFWSPDNRKVLADGLKSAKTAATYIRDFMKLRCKQLMDGGRECKWTYPSRAEAHLVASLLQTDPLVFLVKFEGKILEAHLLGNGSPHVTFVSVGKDGPFKVVVQFYSQQHIGRLQAANSYGIELQVLSDIAVAV